VLRRIRRESNVQGTGLFRMKIRILPSV
jgi:hypothetical protein